jgi:hypothetical protein
MIGHYSTKAYVPHSRNYHAKTESNRRRFLYMNTPGTGKLALESCALTARPSNLQLPLIQCQIREHIDFALQRRDTR